MKDIVTLIGQEVKEKTSLIMLARFCYGINSIVEDKYFRYLSPFNKISQLFVWISLRL